MQWLLEADEFTVDLMYLMCNRAAVAEAFALVPDEDKPTADQLRTYTPKTLPEQSLAWGPLFPQLSMWYNDYENRKKKKNTVGGVPTGGAFDYQATDGWTD